MSDVVKFFINPLLPALAILLLVVFRKRHNRLLGLVVLLYLYGVSIPLSSKLIAIAWSVEDTFKAGLTYDAVIPLTGMASSGWYLKQQKASRPLACYYRFGAGIDRVIAAAEFLQNGHAELLLFGDLRTESFSEGLLVKEFLEKQGIAPHKIVIYGNVTNTLDEARLTRAYTEKNGLRSIVLVTSANHMRRTVALFQKQGLSVDSLSISKPARQFSRHDFVPGIKGLSGTAGLLYEIIGYGGYRLTGKL